ncbi:MAG: phage tail tape measure protein [Thermoplasmata archaeon]|nr:MAG: phage tail tape measure protein [Thermoplasmata archaeon]
MATSRLDIIISARDEASRVFNSIQGNLKAVGTELANVGKKMSMSVSLPLLGAGVAAGKMAMSFSDALTYANTMMGASEEEMKKMRKVALDLASATGKSAIDIMKGFYDVASAGFKGEEAFKIQEIAAKGAMGGFIEHSQAVNALVKNLSIYEKTGDDAAQMMDVMHAIVDKGLLTFDELSTSFARASKFAVPLNISVEEMGAAMGFLSKKTASANEAATALAALTRAFIKPSKEMVDLTKEWAKKQGLAADTTTAQMVKTLGLRGTLKLLTEETGRNEEAMGKLIADSEGLTAALYLTSKEGVKELDENFQHLSNSIGLTDRKAEIASQSFKVRLSMALERLKRLAIEVGTVLLEELLPGLEKAGEKVTDVTEWFSNLEDKEKSLLIKLTALAAFSFPAMWLVGSLMKVIGSINLLMDSMTVLKAKMLLLAGINPYAATIAIAATAIYWIQKVAEAFIKLKWQMEDLTDSVTKAEKGVDRLKNKYVEMYEAGKISSDEMLKGFQRADKGMEVVKKSFTDVKEIWKTLKTGGLPWKSPSEMLEYFGYTGFAKSVKRLGFQEGGVVPGPIGSPVPAIVHGGEIIIPPEKSVGNVFNFNFEGAFIADKESFAQQVIDVINRKVRFSFLE